MHRIDYKKIQNYKILYLDFLGLNILATDTEEEKISKKRNRTRLENKWEELKELICKKNGGDDKLTTNPQLYDLTLDDFLTADFNRLVDIYFDFISLIPDYDKIIHKQGKDGKPISENNKRIEDPLMEEAAATFSFTQTRSSQISNFLYYISSNENSIIKIDSCSYCDINPIYAYKQDDTIKRMYDVEHFIPKEQCPILALCLFNLLPSCKYCNSSSIKGSTPILDFYKLQSNSITKQKEILCKLNPTSESYFYDEEVEIQVYPKLNNKKAPLSPVCFMDNKDCFEIDFNHFDIDYKKETEAFKYINRYNADNILTQALKYLDLKKRYNRNNIRYIKDILNQHGENLTEKDIEEDIFRTEFDTKNGNILSKMKRDIL